jgi:hypothetical protein
MARPVLSCEHATPTCSDCMVVKRRAWNRKSYRKHRDERLAKRAARGGSLSPDEQEAARLRGNEATRRYKATHRGQVRARVGEWYANPANRLAALKRTSRDRGLECLLTADEYAAIVRDGQCVYCTGPLPLYGVGLDRIDNDGDYTRANVVPCCSDCNLARGARFSHEEMLIIGPAIRLVHEQRERNERVAC